MDSLEYFELVDTLLTMIFVCYIMIFSINVNQLYINYIHICIQYTFMYIHTNYPLEFGCSYSSRYVVVYLVLAYTVVNDGTLDVCIVKYITISNLSPIFACIDGDFILCETIPMIISYISTIFTYVYIYICATPICIYIYMYIHTYILVNELAQCTTIK